MKLRTVTIWTTKLTLLLTIMFYYFVGFRGNNDVFVFYVLSTIMGFSALVSSSIADYLKHNISALLLLVSTVAYAFLFVYVLYHFLVNNGNTQVLLPLFTSLYWMLPTWIFILVLELYYGIKSVSDPKPVQDNVK